jgi:folate-binding protein YgfZ
MTDQRFCPPRQPSILVFSGPDVARYLNGQLTQNVTGLGERALASCVTDAKGRLQYFVSVCAGPDPETIWVTLPAEQSDGLRERLERYLIADDAEVAEPDEPWTLIHSDQPDERAVFSRRAEGPFGSGHDLWWPTDQAPDLAPVPHPELERLEIERGLPRWGAELTPGMLPPEAGLDRSAVSYEKGCFMGQEVLSRLKSVGRVNRRLALFEVPPAAAAGDTLRHGDTEAGILTRVAFPHSGDESVAALGYLKKQAYEATEFDIASAAESPSGTARKIRWA